MHGGHAEAQGGLRQHARAVPVNLRVPSVLLRVLLSAPSLSTHRVSCPFNARISFEARGYSGLSAAIVSLMTRVMR